MTREADSLWQALAGVLTEADPMPTEVVRMAQALFAWRTVAAELAALAPADQPAARCHGWKAFPTERRAGPTPG